MTAGRKIPLAALLGKARQARLDELLRNAQRREGSMARRWPTEILRRGTRLFHGTRASADFEHPDGPAWFSTDRAVAQEFVDWHRDAGSARRRRILTYEIVRQIPKLATIGSRGDMAAFMERLGVYGAYGAEDMADAMRGQDTFNGWRIPVNYPNGGDDILLVEPARWLRLVSVERVGR